MAGRNRCGFTLTSGEFKGKKCNLGAGHDVVSESNPTATRHKYTPPVARPALDLSVIRGTVTKVTDTQVMAAHRRTKTTTGEKSEERTFIDQVVQAGYDAWVESGKPKEWARSYGLMLTIPSNQVATFKDRVHTSAKALAYKASFGDDQKNGDSVIVALRVTDLPANESANGNAQTETPAETPPVAETPTA